MNVTSDPTVAETLRSLAASTVRGILQTAGVQALSSEIRQQTTTARSGITQQNASNPNLATAVNNSSTTVELSPAAKFPPLASITGAAAAQNRPSDMVLSAALVLPATLALLTPQSGTEQRVREVMQLAIKLGQTMAASQAPMPVPATSGYSLASPAGSSALSAPGFAAAQYAAMRPWKESIKPVVVRDTGMPLLGSNSSAVVMSDPESASVNQEVRPAGDNSRAEWGRMEPAKSEASAVRADPQKLEAMYAQNGAQGYVRVDISPLVAQAQTRQRQDAAFAATLQVKLPVLGDIVITLALSETRTDLAFAATPPTLELLKLTQNQFRQAAGGWGLNLKGLSFIPFVNESKTR